MGKRSGWLEQLFDSELTQRSDINEAFDDIERTRSETQANVARLAARVRQLSTTVEVLLEILAERGLVQEAEVAARVKAMLASGNRAGAGATVGCVRCGGDFP